MSTAIRILQNYFLPPAWEQTDPARVKLEWLTRLRWIAVFAQSATLAPALKLGYIDPRFFFDYVGTVLLLALFNVFSIVIYRRRKLVREFDVFCQLVADISALSTLLMLTGGMWNPLSPLLFFHAGFGALLLGGAWSILFFLSLTFWLAVLQWIPELPGALRYGPTPRAILFLSDLLVAFVTWRLNAWLAKTLVSMQKHLGLLRDRKMRMDRLRAVGALASGFSHEFATPLNTIKLRLDRLARKAEIEGSADLRAAWEATEQCEIALKSLNDSRIQADHLSLTRVSLSKTVEGVVNTWRKEHPGVEIAISNRVGESDVTDLPQAAFSQIVLNLLDNAFESGALAPRLEIEFFREGDALCFRVSDNGKGIPEVVFRQWGEPFVTAKPDGTGLGLFNALSLAQALGGDFKVRNLKRGGACAEFCLPFAESLPRGLNA